MTEYISLQTTIDLSGWSSAVEQMLADAASLEDLLTFSIEVEADSSEVEELVGEVESVDPEIDIAVAPIPFDEVEDFVEDVEAEAPEVTVVSEVDEPSKLEVLAYLNQVWELAGKIQGAFVKAADATLGLAQPFISTDEALSDIAARTGEVLPGLDRVVERLFAETGMEKGGPVAEALTFLIQNGEQSIPTLERLSLKALDFADIWHTDVGSALRDAQNLVNTGLVPTMDDAFDVMTLGMQTGANRTGDFSMAIARLAPDFKALGLNGQEAIALINANLDAGGRSASRAGVLWEGLATNIKKGTDETKAVLKAADVDISKPLGIEGVTKLIEYIQSIPDEAKKTEAILATFGAGGLQVPLTLPSPEDLQADITGLADEAAGAMDEKLSEAWGRATRVLEDKLVEALDNALNISGFLQKIEDAANTFATKLQEGATIAEALEVALVLEPGTVGRIESAINNLLLGLLEAVATLGDLLGKNTEGLRAEIQRLATGQFMFDIQLARTPEEVGNAIGIAAGHGLSDAMIQEAIGATTAEMIDKGDVQAASDLLQNIQTFLGQFAEPRERTSLDIVTARSPTWEGTPGFGLNVSGMAEDAERMAERQRITKEGMLQNFDDIVFAQDELETNSETTTTNVNTDLSSMGGSAQQFASKAMTGIGQVSEAIVYLTSVANEAAVSMSNLANSGTTARDVVASVGSGSGGEFSEAQRGGQFPPGFTLTGEAGPELAYHGDPLRVWDANTTGGLMNALRALPGVGAGGSRSTTVNNYYTFNTQSSAQDMSAMVQTLTAIRGFGA